MLDLILPWQESDLKMMVFVIFLPSFFALTLLLFPRKSVEWMRWWALFGSAATLTASLCMLIDFYGMLNSRSDRTFRSLHHPATSLEARMDEATVRAEQFPPQPRDGRDWVSRLQWIDASIFTSLSASTASAWQ